DQVLERTSLPEEVHFGNAPRRAVEIKENGKQTSYFEPRPGNKKFSLTLVLTVIAVLFAVGALIYAGPILGQPTPNQTVSIEPPDVGTEVPPGKVTITGKREGSTVIFTWSYPNVMPDDVIYWRKSRDVPWNTTVEGNAIKLTDQPAEEVCIWIRVNRRSGNFTSIDGQKGCA
ncbi:MAG: hypothetical protein CSA83_02580, partial [Actinomycetales bacterium]